MTTPFGLMLSSRSVTTATVHSRFFPREHRLRGDTRKFIGSEGTQGNWIADGVRCQDGRESPPQGSPLCEGRPSGDPAVYDLYMLPPSVSRDSVRICLTLAALNGLDVKCADVQNAYLNAKPMPTMPVIVSPVEAMPAFLSS